jgi:hypothetical protein
MVAGPTVDEIVRRQDVEIIVGQYLLHMPTFIDLIPIAASNSLEEAEKLTRGRENARTVVVDMSNQASVECLLQEADVIIRSVL